MLKRLIREWSYNDLLEAREPSLSPCDMNSNGTTHLTIFPAIGGQIVEFSRYDRKTDNTYSTRYIIHKDEDLADRLSKIITLENLKN